MFEEVDARLKRLDAHRPFDEETTRRIDRVFRPLFIHASNAIEGNTLTLGETIYFIEEGRLPGGKTEEEVLEVRGQMDAYEYLRSVVASQAEPSEKLIRDFHTLLTRKLPSAESYQPGRYKTTDNRPQRPDGSVFPYISAQDTPAEMARLVQWLRGGSGDLHPVQLAAELHYRFILIHPFRDGNGRTARLLMNYVLLSAGYTPVVVRAGPRRLAYLDALEAVDRSVSENEVDPFHPGLKFDPFVLHIEQEILWSLDEALDVVEGRRVLTPEDVARRFEALEARGVKATQGPVDRIHRERELRELAGSVRSEAWDVVGRIVAKANSGRQEISFSREMGTVSSSWVGDHVPAEALDNLGPDTIRVQVNRHPGAVVAVRLPLNEFLVSVTHEPHRLLVNTVGYARLRGGETTWRSHLVVPFDPNLFSRTELEQFLAEEIDRFLTVIEPEVEPRAGR